ncbi:helix-turn-helix transcriptional regulator [Arhodomonas sp. AD133]|uniref:helix-turn-helix transcriptional regulator n=1 Tax=Arhodomonas sp. AD133 TaxID=3415009 RepID=UPI003EBF4BD6
MGQLWELDQALTGDLHVTSTMDYNVLEIVTCDDSSMHAAVDGLFDATTWRRTIHVIYAPGLVGRVQFGGRTHSTSLRLDSKAFGRSLCRGGADFARLLTAIEKERPFHYERPLEPAFQLILEQLKNPPVSPSASALYRQAKTTELFALLFGESSELARASSVSATDVARLRSARNVLVNELVEPPGLRQLALRSGLNEFKLKKGFKELFGTTVYGFVREQRLHRARMLMETKDYNVTRAAMAVGYASVARFSEAFKTRFGISPGRYRMTHRRRSDAPPDVGP